MDDFKQIKKDRMLYILKDALKYHQEAIIKLEQDIKNLEDKE